MNTQSEKSETDRGQKCHGAIAHLAAGIEEAGVRLVANHPGFRSNELATAIHGTSMITSTSEAAAFSVAWGCAAAGMRSAATMKNVGLNDAADAFVNSLALDLSAGMVVFVFDDTDVEYSQIEMDARHYQAFGGGIWLEPATLDEARRFARLAFELSETFAAPVVVRVTNSLLSRGGPVPDQRVAVTCQGRAGEFKRNPERQVVHPANHAARAPEIAARIVAMEEWSERFTRDCNPLVLQDTRVCEVVVGSARTPADIGAGQMLRLPALPLPRKFLEMHLDESKAINVHEHGQPIIASRLAAFLGSVRIHPVRTGSLRPNRRYHKRNHYHRLFSFLKSLPNPIIVGDIGGHTMDPDRSIDMCLCYGSSVSVSTGAAIAHPDASVSSVTGDGAFLHSGKAAIEEANARGARILVCILENGGCLGTGGQTPAGTTMVRHPEVHETTVDWNRQDEALEGIRAAASRTEPVRIIHINTRY